MNNRLLPLIIFNAVYLLVSIFLAARLVSLEFIIYIMVVLVLIAVIAGLDRKYRLPMPLMWLFSFWGFLHMAGRPLRLPSAGDRLGG